MAMASTHAEDAARESVRRAESFNTWGHPTAQPQPDRTRDIIKLAARANELRSLANDGIAPNLLRLMAADIDDVVAHLRSAK